MTEGDVVDSIDSSEQGADYEFPCGNAGHERGGEGGTGGFPFDCQILGQKPLESRGSEQTDQTGNDIVNAEPCGVRGIVLRLDPIEALFKRLPLQPIESVVYGVAQMG